METRQKQILPKLVLATSSPFRRQIFTEHGNDFEVIVSGVDESQVPRDDAKILTMTLAQSKVRAVVEELRKQNRKAVVIGGDQITLCDGEILEKPQSQDEIRRRLEYYPKAELISTISAIAVYNMHIQTEYAELVDYHQAFFKILPFDESEIQVLMNAKITMQTCGALPSGLPNCDACRIIESHRVYNPKDKDSINGLPMDLVVSLCQELGVTINTLAN